MFAIPLSTLTKEKASELLFEEFKKSYLKKLS